MARYIDANELQHRLEQVAKEPDYMHDGDTWDTGVYLAGLWVDKMPTADVVEVVRCKDCIHYNTQLMTCYNNEFPFHCESRHIMRETDYCSYGERRTDNDL